VQPPKIICLNEPVVHDDQVADAEQHRSMRKGANKAPIPAYEDPFNIQSLKLAILVDVPPWKEEAIQAFSTIKLNGVLSITYHVSFLYFESAE
jgi:hypothetical protein